MPNSIFIESPYKRVSAIQKLLSPLRAKGNAEPVSVKVILQRNDEEAIVACNPQVGNTNYRSWMFPTRSVSLICQYFEIWIKTSKGRREFYLQQCSLHLFKKIGPYVAPKEVLSLHCEPDKVDVDVMSRLKRGPHIHVTDAGFPLSKVHLPLNFCHLDDTLVSIQKLTDALDRAIEGPLSEVVQANWSES